MLLRSATNSPGLRPIIVADRNNITRVWMDHAFWPFVTTKLYMNQTGDVEILKEKVSYFKDPQVCRGNKKDAEWNADYGMRQASMVRYVCAEQTGTMLWTWRMRVAKAWRSPVLILAI